MSTPVRMHGLGGPSRDLSGARAAFDKMDVVASKKAHDAPTAQEDHGGEGSEFIKSIVFGGLDGIITTFAVVAASMGADLTVEFVLLMGWANLFADGISMGFGDFLSEKAEIEHAQGERRREMWEMESHPEGEISEMIEIYVEKGMSQEDAETIIHTYAKYKDLYVDLMMVQELGIMPPDDDDNPAMNGAVTFGSFLFFGSVPLWAYVIFYAIDENDTNIIFPVACALTAFAILALGVVKAKILRQPVGAAAGGMLLNGTFAAVAAYAIGYALEQAFQLDEQCK